MVPASKKRQKIDESADGRPDVYVQNEDIPQHVSSSRPRRATAVAAALRIQGKLQRAGIVHDCKAYMQSLSSAVLLAQGQKTTTQRDAVDQVAQIAKDHSADKHAMRPLNCAEIQVGRESVSQLQTSHGLSLPNIQVASITHFKPTTRCPAASEPGPRRELDTSKCTTQRVAGPGYRVYQRGDTRAQQRSHTDMKLLPARVRHKKCSRQVEDSVLSASQGGEWTDVEVKRLLHVCTQKVRPDSANFWLKVSKRMPGAVLSFYWIRFTSCRWLIFGIPLLVTM